MFFSKPPDWSRDNTTASLCFDTGRPVLNEREQGTPLSTQLRFSTAESSCRQVVQKIHILIQWNSNSFSAWDPGIGHLSCCDFPQQRRIEWTKWIQSNVRKSRLKGCWIPFGGGINSRSWEEANFQTRRTVSWNSGNVCIPFPSQKW